MDGYLDLADVRACRACGKEVFRVYDTDGIWLADCDPGVVWDGSTVSYGVRFERLGKRVIPFVHLGRVSPDARCVFRSHDCVPVQPKQELPTRGDKQVSQHDDDPFDKPDSRPSVSFKGAPKGATITCIVDGSPNKVQARNFETGKPETWEDGNPKFTVATDVVVNGEPMTLWAGIPSSMFTAIAEAQKTAGAKIAKGGTLVVRLAGEKPNDNPRLNAQKLYEAHYTPPAAFDAPGEAAPAAQWQPTADATPAQPAAPAQDAQPAAAAAPPWATS